MKTKQQQLFTTLQTATANEIERLTQQERNTSHIVWIGDRSLDLSSVSYVDYSPHDGEVCRFIHGCYDDQSYFYGPDALRAFDLAQALADRYRYLIHQAISVSVAA
jgi:hypothetical protein